MQAQNLLLRNDTFLGVCEGIGQDFGFHPNWLRLALSAGFFFNPLAVALTYVALGVPVAVSRWLFPANSAEPISPLAPVAPVAPEAPVPPAPQDQAQLPLAA